MEMGGITAETVEKIVNEAEKRAAVAEVVAADARRVQREHDRVEKATADADAADRVAAEQESATQAAVLGDGSSVAAQDEESLLAEESQSLAGTIPATSGKSGSMASGEPIVPSSSSVLGSNS